MFMNANQSVSSTQQTTAALHLTPRWYGIVILLSPTPRSAELSFHFIEVERSKFNSFAYATNVQCNSRPSLGGTHNGHLLE